MKAPFGIWFVALVSSLGFLATAAAAPLEDAQGAWDRHDCPMARQILGPPAEQGNASAQLKLGITYEFGGDFGCLQHDDVEAAKWFQKAADQGNAEAEEELANAFYSGRGVLKDYATAMKWYRKAADRGRAFAQLMIGEMYAGGEGVPQDYAEAANWIRRASEQGEEQAQSELAFIYDKGRGIPQDYVQAYKWIILAAARSPAWRTGWREEVVRRRDELATKMTAAQIAEAQKLAREWMPK